VAQQELFIDDKIFEAIPESVLAQNSKEDLIKFLVAQQRVIDDFRRRVLYLEAREEELKQRILFVDGQYIELRNKAYGKSSERESTKPKPDAPTTKEPKPPKTRVLLPSERYPNAEIIERHVTLQTPPTCKCCGKPAKDTGMTEVTEFLTVVPAQYIVVRQFKHIYGCGDCHEGLTTAPSPPRITPGGGYSDPMVIDVALSKYCDLIPIERYAAIAARAGTPGLPPQSLIELTHQLADFVDKAYLGVKREILEARVLRADETPHRMLEGDEKSGWHLWGFSTAESSYFECHDTRSGDVASDLLKLSKCEYLMSDVYSGYGKSVRVANETRKDGGLPLLRSVYCNAHARRYFKKAKDQGATEAQFFIDEYQKIYALEAEIKDKADGKEKTPEQIRDLRLRMVPHFEAMRDHALANMAAHSSKSKLVKAMNYFVGNYAEFTLFTKMPELPIDNNQQEGLLRSPVVGRKTWYGTHSKRGALTTAILFSLVQSCKLIGVNPRSYFKTLVEELHEGKAAFTPKEFKARSLAGPEAEDAAKTPPAVVGPGGQKA
jgi:transposase